MSKFLRRMAELSKRPADFRPSLVSVPPTDSISPADSIAKYESVSPTNSVPPTDSISPAEAVPRRPKPRLARLAQDGHSLAEQAVYSALWESGTPATDGTRIVMMGLGRLSKLARLSENNCRLNIRNLISKLALEEISPENSRAGVGKTYHVYSYAAILERRRAAGLLWVVRTKGVAFVKSERILVPPTESIPPTDSVSGLDSAPPAGSGPGPGTDSVGGPPTDSVPPYRNSFRKEKQEEEPSSSQNSSVIVQRLSRLGVMIDDDAAMRITRRCENANSSATVEEIAYFAELKVQQLAKRRNVENWPGMLISAVPAYFDAPATELQRYRADKERENARSRETARMILNDPEASAEDKEWARGVIGV